MKRRGTSLEWAAWATTATATAYTVALAFVRAAKLPGGLGDMDGHAAAARWLGTLAWWDWRGWSEWFYGGQAMGVNYSPAAQAILRLTDPVWGQLAAVAVIVLALLPYAAWRLARSVGFDATQRAVAVAACAAFILWSNSMVRLMPSFAYTPHLFGSWPKTASIGLALLIAAYAARAERPALAGLIAGLSVLVNASTAPAAAILAAVLLWTATGGTRRERARAWLRWASTAGCTALAVSAWWAVPFVAGRARFVDFDRPLLDSAMDGSGPSGHMAMALMLTLAFGASRRSAAARRLATAAAAVVVGSVVAELVGWPRPEYWLQVPLLAFAVTTAAFAGGDIGLRRTFVAVLGCVAVAGALSQASPVHAYQLLAVDAAGSQSAAVVSDRLFEEVGTADDVLEMISDRAGPGAGGRVMLDSDSRDSACKLAYFAYLAESTDGRVTAMSGLYRETSPTAEFIPARSSLKSRPRWHVRGTRPHWAESPLADEKAHGPVSLAHAEALGVRWVVRCTDEGGLRLIDTGAQLVVGAVPSWQPDDESWHRAAVDYWADLSAGETDGPLPVRGSSGRPAVAARGVSLKTGQDRITVTAEQAGWAWVRVPWDPWWHNTTDPGSEVHKGGPGHIVVWAEEGITELGWFVPGRVDAAAGLLTAGALAALLVVLRSAGPRRVGARRTGPMLRLSPTAPSGPLSAGGTRTLHRRRSERPPAPSTGP